jgi:hypothetical protein
MSVTWPLSGEYKFKGLGYFLRFLSFNLFASLRKIAMYKLEILRLFNVVF